MPKNIGRKKNKNDGDVKTMKVYQYNSLADYPLVCLSVAISGAADPAEPARLVSTIDRIFLRQVPRQYGLFR